MKKDIFEKLVDKTKCRKNVMNMKSKCPIEPKYLGLVDTH